MPTSEVYPRFFEDVSNRDYEEIERAIRDLDDRENSQAGLDQTFASTLRLKAEYATLIGRDLRATIDDAREPKDEPSQLLDRYDATSAYAEEIKAWDTMAPVGREFGSPDFERLMEEDAKAFEANLTRLIEECSRTETAKQPPRADEYLQHAINVQTALSEFGQDVSVSVAAAVWEHYSDSQCACWLLGAETVKSAKAALFRYCSGVPKSWASVAISKIPISNTFTLSALDEHKRLNEQNTIQDRTHKQVIVLRKDLNMRKGKMIAQGAHASMKAVIDTGLIEQTDGSRSLIIPLENDSVGPWLFGKFAKVAVSVDSEDELLALQKEALDRGLVCALIRDAGLTEFGGVPTYTALAIGPHRNEVFEDLTSHLKLL